jgi:hypothetical protein
MRGVREHPWQSAIIDQVSVTRRHGFATMHWRLMREAAPSKVLEGFQVP